MGNSIRSFDSVATACFLLFAMAPSANAAVAGGNVTAPSIKSTPAPKLAVLLAEVRARHPGILAAKRHYEALNFRIAGEGLLPDPILSASMMDVLPPNGPQVSVSQSFPLGRKLELAKQRVRSESDIARFAYLDSVNQVVGDAKAAYFDLYYLQRARALAAQSKILLTRISAIATTKYAVGQGKQVDAIRANVQVAALLRDNVAIERQNQAATTKLLGMLDRPSTGERGQDAFGTIAAPVATLPLKPLRDILSQADAHNPAIARAQTEVAQAQLDIAIAQTITTPDLSAQVGIGRAFMDMGWQTALSGMVGVNLPFPQGQKRQAAAVAGARSELLSREAAVLDSKRQIHARLKELVENLVHLDEQVRIYNHGILPEARLAVAAELTSYRVNRSDIDAWLTAQMDLYRYEREAVEAIVEVHKMHAELEMLTGQEIVSLEQHS